MRQRILLLIGVLLTAIGAEAEIVVIEGVSYSLNNDNTATVVAGESKYAGAVTIAPSFTRGKVTYKVTSIDELAFNQCTDMTSITIPSTITRIGSAAFLGCSIKEVYITDLAAWCKIEFVPGLYSRYVDYDYTEHYYAEGETPGKSLPTLSGSYWDRCNLFNSNPLSRGAQLYVNGKAITDLVIPSTITVVKQGSFAGARCFKTINTGNSVKTIEPYAFSDNEILTSVTIGNKVERIDYCAFGRSYLVTSSWNDRAYSYHSKDSETLTEVHISDIAAWCKINFTDDTSPEYPYNLNNITEYANPLHGAKHLYLGDKELTDLTIPEGVSFIAPSAFVNCESIKSLTLPASLKSIGKQAFEGCKAITSCTANMKEPIEYYWDTPSYSTVLRVPQGTTDKYHAAEGWSEFKIITELSGGRESYYRNAIFKENTVEGIEMTFQVYEYDESKCYVYGYEDYSAGKIIPAIAKSHFDKVTIPSEVKGKKVASSSSYAFYNCCFDELIVPGSMVSFDGCMYNYSLKSVKFEEGLEGVSGEAFLYCVELNTVDLPSTVTTIGENAFQNCSNLSWLIVRNPQPPVCYSYVSNGKATLFVPAGCVEVYKNAPYWKNFKEIREIGSNTQYVDGQTFIENTKEGVSVTYKVLSATEMTCEVADNRGLTAEKITIPAKVNGFSVMRVGDLAFTSNTNLQVVTFDEDSQLEYIGKWAFSGSSLKEFLMPKGVKEMGEAPFKSCDELETFRFSSALASIPNGFFANNKSLKTVTWTSNPTIKSIPYRAFANCESLETIEIPASVTSIGESAFASCSSLKSITLPANLTSIDYEAFAWSGLTEVTLPDNLKTLGGYVFYYCKDLKTLNMGNGLTEWDGSNINGCDAIESIQCSDGLTKIDKEAFSKKSKLRSFTFGPNSKLEEIGERAFAESGLTSFVMPNSVKTIGESAFWWCWLLEDITLSEQLTAIPSLALAYTKIKELSIPASVTATGYNSFSGQESVSPYTNTLTDVYIYATTPPVKCEDSYASDSRYISGSARDATLHVPYGTKAAYAAAEGWKSFKAIVEMEGDVIPGDLSGDGVVNATDLVMLVNTILTNKYSSIADLNNDDVVNATDYVIMVNKILNKQ